MALIPADEKQCQAEISYYHPFMMGGSVRGVERCKARPSFTATEVVAGPDGQKGSMSLCPCCKDQLVILFCKVHRPLPEFTVISCNLKEITT